MLTTHGYSVNDMIIASCPSAEQVSVLLSSASILAAEDVITLSSSTDSSSQRKTIQSSSSNEENEKSKNTDRKVSFDQEDPIVPVTLNSTTNEST